MLMKRKTMNDKPEPPQPPEEPPGSESGALIEPSDEAAVRLEGELAEAKDRYLRLAAEYDNFKKRSAACGLVGLRSGWYCFARRRNAFLISSVVAVSDTPRIW